MTPTTIFIIKKLLFKGLNEIMKKRVYIQSSSLLHFLNDKGKN